MYELKYPFSPSYISILLNIAMDPLVYAFAILLLLITNIQIYMLLDLKNVYKACKHAC